MLSFLKYTPWILIAVLLSGGYFLKIGYDKKIDTLQDLLVTSKANERISIGDLKSCKDASSLQNESISKWKEAANVAQMKLDKASAEASQIRADYEKRIREILKRPIADSCSTAIKELKESAKGDAVW